MVDFICMGLIEMWGAQTENYKMKNSCPQWDSNPVSIALKDQIFMDYLKVDRV